LDDPAREPHALHVARSRILKATIGTLIVIGTIYGLLLGAVVIRTRDAARRVSNARTLQAIRTAMQMYADSPDNLNHFPDAGSPAASLALVYPNYIPDFCIFLDARDPDIGTKRAHVQQCMRERRPVAECYDDIGVGYEPGLMPTDPMAILLYEKTPSNGGRNVCLAGGWRSASFSAG
jgi:hypothetical protein